MRAREAWWGAVGITAILTRPALLGLRGRQGDHGEVPAMNWRCRIFGHDGPWWLDYNHQGHCRRCRKPHPEWIRQVLSRLRWQRLQVAPIVRLITIGFGTPGPSRDCPTCGFESLMTYPLCDLRVDGVWTFGTYARCGRCE